MHTVTIAGRVIDQISKNAIPNAAVRVRRRLGPVVGTFSSDIDGEFEFNYDVSGGERLVLRVDKDPGYARSVYTLTPMGEDEDDHDVGNIPLTPYASSPAPSATLPSEVRFVSAKIADDTDFWGSGEIYFKFTVNQRDLVTGKHDISGGDTVTFPDNYKIAIPSGATNVSVQIAARDDDTEFGENNPFLNPNDYDDLGTKAETWSSALNFGRGTHQLTAAKFTVTYTIA